MKPNGRPRTSVVYKINKALQKGRGVNLPLRDVHALVDIPQPLTTDQYAQLHDIAKDWERTGRNCSSFAVQAVYNNAAEQLLRWVETQQGEGDL